jgi:predicted molibdopterin-dependent oxidoreductase YjgC
LPARNPKWVATMVLPEDQQMFVIEVDGQPVPARPGETVAAALLAAGRRIFRHTASGAPRGLFCGMGVCFDCLVTIDGLRDQRACMTLARPGMLVQLDPQEFAAHVVD